MRVNKTAYSVVVDDLGDDCEVTGGWPFVYEDYSANLDESLESGGLLRLRRYQYTLQMNARAARSVGHEEVSWCRRGEPGGVIARACMQDEWV